jgi:hypothetical protein
VRRTIEEVAEEYEGFSSGDNAENSAAIHKHHSKNDELAD